jgi:hypothetical protein
MEKTTIYLTHELRLALCQAARQKGRPQAALIREAIACYLESTEPPWPKTAGMFEGFPIPAEQVDDWIENHWNPE